MVININRRSFLAYTAALASAASSATRSDEDDSGPGSYFLAPEVGHVHGGPTRHRHR